VTVKEVQVSTNMMVKYGIGKLVKPPVAKGYVKLELLQNAKKSLNIK
jgi:NitT/TauT family transport system substrate-binding protein